MAGFFVVVLVVEVVVEVEPVDDESLADEPVVPVDVDEPVPVEPLFDEEPIDEPLPEPVVFVDESLPVVPVPSVELLLGVVGAGVAAAGVVDVDVVLLVSVIVPDVFCVSGVFGGSFSPPHATRPATHAPTIRAETFMRTPELAGRDAPARSCFSPRPASRDASWMRPDATKPRHPFPIDWAPPSAVPVPRANLRQSMP